MTVLKLTDKPSELEAVKDKAMEELQYLRSLDTAGDGGGAVLTAKPISLVPIEALFSQVPVFSYICATKVMSLSPRPFVDINMIKNQINSLLFVRKVCETRIQRLQSGKVRTTKYSMLPFSLNVFSSLWLLLAPPTGRSLVLTVFRPLGTG